MKTRILNALLITVVVVVVLAVAAWLSTLDDGGPPIRPAEEFQEKLQQAYDEVWERVNSG